MFYVTSIDGLIVEPLSNVGSDFKMEQSTDGSMTVSLSTYNLDYNPGYEVLKGESILTVDGFDFKIKSVDDDGSVKKVKGVNLFFESLKTVKHDIFGGTKTLKERVDFVLSDTGWSATFEDDVVNDYQMMMNFGKDNVVKLIRDICEKHAVEFEVRRNKTLHFSKNTGGDEDYQYRYNYNVSDVVLVEDTNELFTVIKGTGKDGIEATYTSPNVNIFGHLEALPVTNSEIETVEELTKWLSTQIQDEPKVAIESKVVDLVSRKTGENVWLFYKPLNVEIRTRIVKQVMTLDNNKLVTSEVVLGNVIPKTFEDILIEQNIKIDVHDKKNRSLFEQTNSYFLMEVERVGESISRVTQTASDIRSEVEQLAIDFDEEIGTVTENYTSYVNQSADAIRADVNSTISVVNGNITSIQSNLSTISQKADQIDARVTNYATTVDSYGRRISSAESSISINSQAIVNKVESSDYTGNVIATMITQTASDYSIKASKINMDGALIVNGTINGGVITGAQINTTHDLTVGDSIYLNMNANSIRGRVIWFGPNASIRLASLMSGNTVIGGKMTISPPGGFAGGLEIQGDTSIIGKLSVRNQEVDFTGSTITGLSGLAVAHTPGIGIAFSTASKRLVVRINGVDVASYAPVVVS